VLIPRAKEIEQNITVGDVASLQFVIPHLQAIAEHYLSLVEDENNVILPFLGIGRYYYGQGFYSLAEHWYEKCLQATKNRLGKEHPNFAQCLNNLALVHSVQGKYGKAELGFRKAIELFTPYSKQHQNQENHLIQASFINNLGQLYQAQRKYTEAESLHSQALNIRKCQLGEEKFDVAQSLNNLAEVYRAQGKYKEAEPLYNQAIEISELDEENLDVATFINNLALLYHAQGWYKKAESKFFKALEILKRMLVQDHPRIASCLSNIAGLYYTQGQYEKAEPLYRQALEIFDRALGSDHPNTINCRENLEIMRSERGESEI
jgi:tetratricopeptide (TPR) repeat protein